MMTILIAFLILVVCLYVFIQASWIWHINLVRRKGLYPEKDKATLFDVRRLLVHGERELAIRLYCTIFRVRHAEGKQAVAAIERNIQGKNIERE